MILVNGLAEDRIAISDRGLQYGDGLFETMAYRDGTIEFFDTHLTRLLSDCQRLNIPFQQISELRDDVNQVCQSSNDDAVIKIIITRGRGGRGYSADSNAIPTRIVSSHPYPNYPDANTKTGVTLRFCQHPISENTALAGMKHLNRLDQVLARNEWQQEDIAEGLLFNNAGNIIEGTMSNLFIIISGRIITPKLDKAGVKGVMRATVMNIAKDLELIVQEDEITKQDLLNADEIFICNSIIGIWPISYIKDSGRQYPVGTITHKLQYALQEIEK